MALPLWRGAPHQCDPIILPATYTCLLSILPFHAPFCSFPRSLPAHFHRVPLQAASAGYLGGLSTARAVHDSRIIRSVAHPGRVWSRSRLGPIAAVLDIPPGTSPTIPSLKPNGPVAVPRGFRRAGWSRYGCGLEGTRHAVPCAVGLDSAAVNHTLGGAGGLERVPSWPSEFLWSVLYGSVTAGKIGPGARCQTIATARKTR